MNKLSSPFEIKEIKEDSDNYIVEGMASVYGNVDLGDDIVESGAFGQDLIKRGNERPILWQHFSSEPIGIGKFTEMQDGLFVKIYMPKTDQFVKERVMPQIKIGSVKGLSIGYSTEDFDYQTVNNKRIRRLKRCGLRETSAVTFPMNEEAQIIAAKEYLLSHNVKTLKDEDSKTVPAYQNYDLMSIDTKWDKGKAVKQIREKTGSQESASESYKNGFMFFDSENEDKLTAYKLPYVMVVDNKFKAVPRAIFAITAALSGARGGINIPESDKSKIKSQLNKYYEKLDREPPFKGNQTFIDIDTIKVFERIDFEKLFKKDNDIILSNHAEKYIIDRIIHGEKTVEDPIKENNILDEFKELNRKLSKIKGD